MRLQPALLISSISFVCLVSTTIVGQQSATEAPAGFSTPTITQNPGSQVRAMVFQNPPEILSPKIKPNLSGFTIHLRDSDRCSTPPRAGSVIRTG